MTTKLVVPKGTAKQLTLEEKYKLLMKELQVERKEYCVKDQAKWGWWLRTLERHIEELSVAMKEKGYEHH